MFQWLQNHSCKGRNSNRQSPFVVSYKAAFLHWLNAQRQTAFAKSNRVFMLSVSVSGRFDEAVIEERRKATEAMLLFTTTIPALYNSPQLKEFFRVRNTHIHTHMCTQKEICQTKRCIVFILPPSTPQHLLPSYLPSSPTASSSSPSLLSGWWGHKASGSHLFVLCRASASASHPAPQAEDLGLWTRRGGGGEGGPHLTARPGHQRGLRGGRTGGGGRSLQRDGRLSERGRTRGA